MAEGTRCAWPGCSRTDINGRGLCRRHYAHVRRSGRLGDFPLGGGRPRRLRQLTPGRQCERCSAQIDAAKASRARFCSRACARDGWFESHPLARSERHHERRARAAGVTVEAVDFAAVWKRDSGVCWICERVVDPGLPKSDPLSRTFDHVIPFARGGGHVMSNVAVAHRRCNQVKSDKVLDRPPKSLASTG